MEVSYDKLFSFLYKNNISKLELSEKTGISRNTLIKMSKGEVVHLKIILAICEAYNLDLCDVVEIKK